MRGHGCQMCPDRFAPKGKSIGAGKGQSFKGKGAGPGKGAGFKGNSKGKGFNKGSFGKGKTYNISGVLAQWDDHASHGRAPTRAILDTGATKNAIGLDSLHDLVSIAVRTFDDRPGRGSNLQHRRDFSKAGAPR